MGFFTILEERARQVDSLLCVGLDPHFEDLSSREPAAVLEFCRRLINATQDLVLAYKPNIAFFEVFGKAGAAVLETVVNEIPQDIPVILDAKRGDISSSAKAYSYAVFNKLGVDAVTINPYLGYDALEPFLVDEKKGVFLLCKTSNPGSADIQEVNILRESMDPAQNLPGTVFELIASRAVEWNRKDNLGLVVGATQIDALSRVRKLAPELWILSPGVGPQGGDLAAALREGLRPDGLGLIIPVSRSLARANDPRKVAEEIRKQINHFREKKESGNLSLGISFREQELMNLAKDLLNSGCVEFGQFKLKSGLTSPIYFDLRRLVSFPGLLSRVADSYLEILAELKFDRLAAVPYAGLPIATAIGLRAGIPVVYPRKEIKSYGMKAEIEGCYSTGERVVLIDDLVTTGGSKFEALAKLIEAGLQVEDVVVLIDRQSGAAEELSRSGYRLHGIFSLANLLEIWSDSGLVSPGQISAVKKFVAEAGEN